MEKPNYPLLSFAVVLAILVGILGGGVMGGFAGYYVAVSAMPTLELAPAGSANPNPNPPAFQAAPPVTTNLVLKEDSAVIDAVRKAKPAVVTVVNQMQSRRGFFGGSTPPTASGSGVIVDSKGHIITNGHVIEGVQSLQVIYADGSKADATVVGIDPVADIAVLKVEGKLPAVAELGDSNSLEPGQIAIAIGSPLGDFRGTVTLGIISALNRRVGRQQGLIQTDAAINNGNSGGPLINTMGQVIGINTLVVRSTSEGNVAEGLGFAIPSNLVREIVAQLIAKGKVDRPYIGVNYQEVDPQVASALNLNYSQGVVVTQVEPSSPAAQAGLKESDVILALDSFKIDQDHPLQTILFTHKVGDTVTLTVLRDSKQIQVKLTLAPHPSS
ncbi:MAG: trypsin-like peptidase domain-containing protein [Chloroflexi bacterium]|nr:trypsin-like peptidase domain-containing protein [Chloroflexota bacterium]